VGLSPLVDTYLDSKSGSQSRSETLYYSFAFSGIILLNLGGIRAVLREIASGKRRRKKMKKTERKTRRRKKSVIKRRSVQGIEKKKRSERKRRWKLNVWKRRSRRRRKWNMRD
jgi:hypothetical protein